MKTSVLIFALTLIAFTITHPAVTWAQVNGSGSLSVELVDGTLFILGDREPNKIVVSQYQDSDGVELIVVGGDGTNPWDFLPWIPYDWTSDTTVNGGGVALYDASNVAEIVLLAGDGDDQILMHGNLDPDIFIDGGAGGDLVDLINTFIAGTLYINTGRDRDRVLMIGTGVAGNTEISTGHGSDTVELRQNSFLGDLTLNLGAHADVLVTFRGIPSISGDLLVEMGQGDDSVRGERVFDPPEFAVGGLATFDGGQGGDTFDPSGMTDLDGNPIDSSNLVKLNFELP